MAKIAHTVASLAVFLMFLGCAQTSPPQACQGVSQEKLPNCIYVNSVLNQDPFPCYALLDHSQRTTCIKDATDPLMKSEIERSSQQQRDLIFAPEGQQNQIPLEIRQPQTQNPVLPQQPSETGCMAKAGGERDVCFLGLATESGVIIHCSQIVNKPLRESCIAHVARATRSMESCETLAIQEDYEICLSYTQGNTE